MVAIQLCAQEACIFHKGNPTIIFQNESVLYEKKSIDFHSTNIQLFNNNNIRVFYLNTIILLIFLSVTKMYKIM